MGWDLALRFLPRRDARRGGAALAVGGVGGRGRVVASPSLFGRARDGVGGRLDRRVLLIRTPLSTTSVLDEAAEVVAMTATPWAALLMATSVPHRFLQALFLDQLMEVGTEALKYGNLPGRTANLIVLTVVLALWGRAVYARAVRLGAARGSAPGRDAWRIRPAALACYILAASASMLIGYVTLFTVMGFVVAVMFAGVAVGTIELNERVSITRPFTLIFRYTKQIGIPLALVLVFFCALLVAFVNLAAASGLATWLVSAIGGFDAPNWQALFTLNNRRFVLLLCAGAFVLVEPFWIAAHVIYVRKAGAEESGDDLRAWFDELARGTA